MDTKKRIAYLLVVGIVLIFVRNRLGSYMPQFASLGIAIILTIVSIGLLIVEKRLDLPFFLWICSPLGWWILNQQCIPVGVGDIFLCSDNDIWCDCFSA